MHGKEKGWDPGVEGELNAEEVRDIVGDTRDGENIEGGAIEEQ